uniref:Tail protein n=1 Tax=viral metagenome TaxID=1070528 RepID=A0A6M3KG46_9ZZZZ
MPVPQVQSKQDPITSVTVSEITDAVAQKNAVGTTINPATEDSLALVKTAVEAINTALQTAGITQAQLAAIQAAVQIIDNFISGSRGLVTEDNSAAIKTATEAVPYKGTTPTIYNVTLTSADTEYSQALSANTKKFAVHLRDYSAFRFAYVTGKVAAPTAPYETIPSGSEKVEELIQPAAITLYFASAAAGKIAEIEEWV